MATQEGRVLRSNNVKNSVVTDDNVHKNGKNSVETDSVHKNGKNSVETDSVHKDGKSSVVTAEMSAAHQGQEFTPERNGQEKSPSHSAQESGDSDSDTVRERAPERDMSFSFQVAPPDWFTDKMDRMYQNLNETNKRIYHNLHETIQRNEQSADLRYTSLIQQMGSIQQQVNDNANAIANVEQKVNDNANAIANVEQKVDDNANAILSVTTGFSKFSDTLTTVQCKLDALQNRYDSTMSTPSTVGSNNTVVKSSQSNRPVDTVSTYSQQSTVCSTVVPEPLGSLPSIPLPPTLPVSYNMHAPPVVNVSVARATSQVRSPPRNYQNRTAGTQDSLAQNFVTSSSTNQSSMLHNNGNQGFVTPSSGGSSSSNPSSGGQCSSNLGPNIQSSGAQGSVNRSAVCQSQDTTVNSIATDRMTLEKPRNISIKFPVYEVGDSFHTFVSAFEAVLQRYGMMDEAALRLPECFSPSALALYLSLPQKVRSSYTESVAVLRQFWPALPGVSNFDDLNDNYGLPLLKQGQDSIEQFATKVCAVATSIAKDDAKRFDRLAKYMLWRGMSADAHLWMDKCYDDDYTFVDFYTLCRRLSLNPAGVSTSTPQVRFDLSNTPQVLAAEVKVPGSSMSPSSENTGIVKSPQQWKSSRQWHSPPRRSNASYKGSPNWRSNSRLTSSPSGSDSPNWRGNGSSSPRGSSSPNWRNRDNTSSSRDGSIEKAIKNLTAECSVIGSGLKTLVPTLDNGFASVRSDFNNGFASVRSDFNLGFQSLQKSLSTLVVGSPERPSRRSQFKSSPGSTPRRRSPDSPIYDRSRIKCFSCREYGHFQNECPRGRYTPGSPSRDRSHVVCFGCQELGHYKFQCPSLQAAASPKVLSGSPGKGQGKGLK